MNYMEILQTFGVSTMAMIALAVFIVKYIERTEKKNDEREKRYIDLFSEAQTQMRELSQTNASFIEILNTYKTDIQEIKEDIEDIKDEIQTKKGAECYD